MHNDTKYWRCHNYSKRSKGERCKARCTLKSNHDQILSNVQHNHEPHTDKIAKFRNYQEKYKQLSKEVKNKKVGK